jgi:hypothetical protein
MKVVPDPYSTRQISAEEINRVKNGMWAKNGKAADSVGLAMLHFRVNSTRLERTYMDNARTLDVIHRTFSDKKLLTDMDFITITAAASPEGYSAQNAILAQKRAMAIKSYIMWKYPFMNRESIFTFSIGEDWTGLRKMVEDDRSTPQREEALRILDSDHDNNTKRSMLRRLGGGTSYRHMAIHHLPRLRGGAACMIYYKPKPEPVITDTVRVHTHSTDTVHVHTHTVDTVYVERVVEKLLETAAKPRRPYYWAVKSNMLYDAVLVPDLAVEFTIGRHVSLELNGQWSWWNSRGHHKWAWRFQMAGLEARYWLGNRHRRTPLSGHALGLYGIYGNYDIRFGPDHTGNLSRESFSAGLSYSYGLPVARSWNIEFGISVGYMRGRYETYTSYDDDRGVHLRDNGHLRSYIGPTKLRISISWLPGGKNNLPAAKDKKNKK